MSKRKQKHNPITYKEKPPAWKMIPENKSVLEPKKIKEEPPALDYEEIIIGEAEAAENDYQEPPSQEADEVVRVVCKEKTREFIRKEMDKLLTTLDELVEYDDHSYVVNFVLEMSGQAKKKFWEMQGVTNK